MSDIIATDVLARLADLIASRMGLHLPPERWGDLRRGIRAAAPEFGFSDAAACAAWLAAGSMTSEQVHTLAGHLTVGETYFFRDKPAIAALTEHVLPDLIAARRGERRLRIWSAGCCTGEEPYTVAMLLTMLLPDLQDWNITLLATDINRHFLRKAAEGTFSDWSFRDTPTFVKERFFIRTSRGKYQILPALRNMVTFAPLNLADDAYPALLNNTTFMDLLLCRNVLIYLGAMQTRSVVQRLSGCVREGGWLLVAPTEVSNVSCPELETVSFEGGKAFRKKWMVAPGTPDAIAPARVTPEVTQAALANKFVELQTAAQYPLVAGANSNLAGSNPPVHANQTADLDHVTRLLQTGNARRAVELLMSGSGIDEFPPVPGSEVKPAEAALLARALANLGSLAHAMLWCDRAIVADKMDPSLHYLRAMILHELGEDEAGSESLRRTIYLDDEFVMAHVALADLSRRQGRSDESSRHFRNAAQLLRSRGQDEVVPESDGLTVARLVELIESMSQEGGVS